MHCVPAKTAEQQAILVVHQVRAAVVAAHPRAPNPIRGLLAEFGIVVPKGVDTMKARRHEVRQRFADDVPALAWDELDALFDQLRTPHTRVLAYDRKLKAFIRQNPTAQRLTAVKGIGPITASALVATVGNAHEFRNGRQFAAWLGLTPRQHSTGGKKRLGRIAERGDIHLRTLIVDVARSELMYTP